MQRVYLVRHAQPQAGYRGRYDLLPGPPLSATGRFQAQRTGRFLAQTGIARIYHSPFQRAKETAAIIAEETGRLSHEIAALSEWENGTPIETIRERITQFWHTTIQPNGQSADPPQLPAPVAIVSHGAPLDQLLRYLGGATLDLSRHRYWGGAATPLAGIWRAEQQASGWQLELIFNPDDYV